MKKWEPWLSLYTILRTKTFPQPQTTSLATNDFLSHKLSCATETPYIEKKLKSSCPFGHLVN